MHTLFIIIVFLLLLPQICGFMTSNGGWYMRGVKMRAKPADPDELRGVIEKMNSETRQKDEDGPIEVRVCKLCEKGNKCNADNLWKLNVRHDGSYYCYRCSSGGSYYDLKKKVNAIEDTDEESSTTSSPAGKKSTKSNTASAEKEKKYVLPNQKQAVADYHRLFPEANDAADAATVKNRQNVFHYLNNIRGIHNDTLRRYGVGFNTLQFLHEDSGEWQDQLCVSFPWMMSEDEVVKRQKINVTSEAAAATHTSQLTIEGVKCVVVRSKYRALATKGLQRISPKGGQWGFFGWHLVNPPTTTTTSTASSDSIIITEGEYDAMAVAQALSDLKNSSSSGGGGAVADSALSSIPVVSLPNGCNSLPVELVALLEPFSRIYLWLDNDKSGIDACEKFVKKLGVLRCVVVRPEASDKNPPKDANDALRDGGSVRIAELLHNAQTPRHNKIQTFNDLKNEVFASIRKVDVKEGSQTSSLPALSKICKGFRKGELVVFSGPTGSGKTTLLSQLSLDFAKEGAATLWGSFEIKNNRLALKMLQQSYKHGALNTLTEEKLQQVASDFDALPIQFMNFHGSTAIDEIIEAMEFAIHKDDIQHVIIDNLQFMMPRGSSSGRGAMDKFEYQDMVIDKLRRLATEKNVNVILVIHPRKEDDAVPLGMSSIFGSAKATQEADIVMLLQKLAGNKMSLDIKKNRYDGVLGRIELDFNPVNLCYFERTTAGSKGAAASTAKAAGTAAASAGVTSASSTVYKQPVAASRKPAVAAPAPPSTTSAAGSTATTSVIPAVLPASVTADSVSAELVALPKYKRNRSS